MDLTTGMISDLSSEVFLLGTGPCSEVFLLGTDPCSEVFLLDTDPPF
jgi:hypothetical protein